MKNPTNPALLLGIIACALRAFGIATLAAFPPIAQALPKNCGKTFTLDREKHCVNIETASDEGAVLNVVSTLPEGVKGLEYRQYRVLASCRNALLFSMRARSKN